MRPGQNLLEAGAFEKRDAGSCLLRPLCPLSIAWLAAKLALVVASRTPDEPRIDNSQM